MAIKFNFDEPTVRAYMRTVISAHTDPTTGEVNSTGLAEAAAERFEQDHVGGPLDAETHWIWEAAVNVAGDHNGRPWGGV